MKKKSPSARRDTGEKSERSSRVGRRRALLVTKTRRRRNQKKVPQRRPPTAWGPNNPPPMGVRFAKKGELGGQIRNLNGRPPSVATLILRRTNNLTEFIDYALRVFRGEDIRTKAERARFPGLRDRPIGLNYKLDIMRELMSYAASKPRQELGVSGQGGAPLTWGNVTYNLRSLSDEQLAQLELILSVASAASREGAPLSIAAETPRVTDVRGTALEET